MSDTHEARVVRIGEIRPHTNADKLALTTIGDGDGYQMVIGKDGLKTGDLAVFIQPESIVPQTPPFSFIWLPHVPKIWVDEFPIGQTVYAQGETGTPEGTKKWIQPVQEVPAKRRLIMPKRLRGEWSEGLLIPLEEFTGPADPEGKVGINGRIVSEGDDVASLLGIEHYEPEADAEKTSARTLAAPKRRYPKTLRGWFWWSLMKLGFKRAQKNYAIEVSFDFPVYDVNALKNAGRHGFKPGERVQVTEKIHGSNARYVVIDGVQYCGSHEQWKADGPNVWWNAYRQFPQIGEWCFQHPGMVLYGEVGPTQKGFRYGAEKDETFFFAFDVFIPEGHESGLQSGWVWPGNMGFAPTAPSLYVGSYDYASIAPLVDGNTTVPTPLNGKHIREGVVVRSLETGRKLKVKSNEFMKIAGNR